MEPSVEVVPAESQTLASIVEVKQITIASDDEVSYVNDLLSEGWKLLHNGHLSQSTVYVLGKPTQQTRRRSGFLT
jgi:hypothetical protein